MNSSIDSLVIGYLVLLLFYFFKFIEGGKRFLLIVIVFFLILLLYYLKARAVFIGTVCTMFYWQGLFNKSRLKIFVLSFLAIIAFAFFKPDSSFSRLLIWKISLKIWFDNWLYGIYPRLFNPIYNHYQIDYFSAKGLYSKEAFLGNDGYYAFNEWLELIVSFGIVGLLFILVFWSLVYYLFKMSIRNDAYKDLRLFLGLLIPVLVLSFFSYPFHRPGILCFTILCLAGCFFSTTFHIWHKRYRIFLKTSTYGAVIIFFIFQEAKALRDNKNWEEVKQIWEVNKSQENFQDLVDFYCKYKLLEGVAEYVAIQYWYLSKTAKAIKVLEEHHEKECNQRFHALWGKWYDEVGDSVLAHKNLEMSLYINPHLLQSRMDLALFFKKHNNEEMAKYWANEVIRYPIKVNNPHAFRLKDEANKIFFSY